MILIYDSQAYGMVIPFYTKLFGRTRIFNHIGYVTSYVRQFSGKETHCKEKLTILMIFYEKQLRECVKFAKM